MYYEWLPNADSFQSLCPSVKLLVLATAIIYMKQKYAHKKLDGTLPPNFLFWGILDSLLA